MNIILFIGFSETVVILILAVMIFGADKLPEFARTFSKTIRQIKDASDGIKREIMNPIEDIKKEVKDQTKAISHFEEVKKEIAEAREEIEEVTRKPVKRE